MPGADGEQVPDEVELTQVGRVKLRQTLNWSRIEISFRCGPGDADEGYVSMLEGRLSVAQAVPLVARGDYEGMADCVRHTTAGLLTKAGFVVRYKPEKTIPGHVGVYPNAEWDSDKSESFDGCFSEYVRGLIK